jgi:hypothetical protein
MSYLSRLAGLPHDAQAPTWIQTAAAAVILGWVAAFAFFILNDFYAAAIPGVVAVAFGLLTPLALWLARRQAKAAEDARARATERSIVRRRQEDVRWAFFLAERRAQTAGMPIEDALVQAAVKMQLPGGHFSFHRYRDLDALFPHADSAQVDRALRLFEAAERTLSSMKLTTTEQNVALLSDRCPGLSLATYERLLHLEYFNRR